MQERSDKQAEAENLRRDQKQRRLRMRNRLMFPILQLAQKLQGGPKRRAMELISIMSITTMRQQMYWRKLMRTW